MPAESIARLVIICSTAVLLAAIAAAWSLAFFRGWRVGYVPAPKKAGSTKKDGEPAAAEPVSDDTRQDVFKPLRNTA